MFVDVFVDVFVDGLVELYCLLLQPEIIKVTRIMINTYEYVFDIETIDIILFSK